MSGDPAAFTEIACESIGPVYRISLNRPQVRNAQNRALLDQLEQAINFAANDDRTRVVILAAKGDHFSAGHDLKEAQRDRSHQTAQMRFDQEEDKYFGICMRLRDCPKPTVAQVQGACIAGGFMLVNMCDLIVASEDAFFSDPVVHTVALAGAEVLVHPYVMGFRKAKEFLFTGRRMSAREALEIGMINRLVEREALEDATLQLAEHIAKAPPFAMKLTKRSLNRMMDMLGYRSGLEAHFDSHQVTHHSTEFAEIIDGGLAASIQKGKENV